MKNKIEDKIKLTAKEQALILRLRQEELERKAKEENLEEKLFSILPSIETVTKDFLENDKLIPEKQNLFEAFITRSVYKSMSGMFIIVDKELCKETSDGKKLLKQKTHPFYKLVYTGLNRIGSTKLPFKYSLTLFCLENKVVLPIFRVLDKRFTDAIPELDDLIINERGVSSMEPDIASGYLHVADYISYRDYGEQILNEINHLFVQTREALSAKISHCKDDIDGYERHLKFMKTHLQEATNKMSLITPYFLQL